MDKISDVRVTKCESSIYIQPARMHYKQNGKPRIWDLMKVHDSVAVVIFNVTRQVLVFVKQFRPAVYYNSIESTDDGRIDTSRHQPSSGCTLELCAGIVDKDISLAEVTREEILEECGYDVPLSSIRKVTSYRSGVGVTGSLQTLFYAEVNDVMKLGVGGGNETEGELIEVVEMTLPEARRLIYDETIPRPVSFLFALMWFFENHLKDANATVTLSGRL